VLVRLRGVDAQLKLDEAQAAARRADANVALAESQNTLAQTTSQRYGQPPGHTGDVSRTVADQARTQAETQQQTVLTARAVARGAQAQLALAQKALGDVVVTAPFPGYISARQVSVGEYVQPMNPVVTLVEIESASPAVEDSRRPGGSHRRRSTGERIGRCIPWPHVHRRHHGHLTVHRSDIEVVHRRRTDSQSRRGPQAGDVCRGDDRPGSDRTRLLRANAPAWLTMSTPTRFACSSSTTRISRIFASSSSPHEPLRILSAIIDGVKEGERVATSGPRRSLRRRTPSPIKTASTAPAPHAEAR